MEEIKVTNLGSSLPVPCVQELAKEALTTVPPRYVRLDQDPPFVSDSSSLPKVPVIDMQSLTSEDLMDKELEKLHHACKHWGFFQVSLSLSLSLSHSLSVWVNPSILYLESETMIRSAVQKGISKQSNNLKFLSFVKFLFIYLYLANVWLELKKSTYFTIINRSQYSFDTIHRSYYIISVNFYFYLQYIQQKVFNFSKISKSQTYHYYYCLFFVGSHMLANCE